MKRVRAISTSLVRRVWSKLLGRRAHEREIEKDFSGFAPTLILVVGFESTATRATTHFIRSLGGIHFPAQASSHHDPLDAIWDATRAGDLDAATAQLEALRVDASRNVILTRRSVPHAADGIAATPDDIPPLRDFLSVCVSAEERPLVLILVRDFAACIGSAAAKRASANRSVRQAVLNYGAAYRAIFRAVVDSDAPFVLIPPSSFDRPTRRTRARWVRILGLQPTPAENPRPFDYRHDDRSSQRRFDEAMHVE